jgi:cell division protein FtsL
MALGWKGSYYRYKEFFLNISAIYKEKADLRAFLEIVLSITTVIVFLLFALKPTALTIIDLSKQIKEEKETLAALNQKIDDLKTANTLITQNQTYLQDTNIAVPTYPNPDILSKQIEGLAQKNSVEVLGIAINRVNLKGDTTTQKTAVGLKPMPGNAYEMPFSISIRGSYIGLLGLIKDVEKSRIAIKIDGVGITSSLTDKGRVIVAVIAGRIPYIGK